MPLTVPLPEARKTAPSPTLPVPAVPRVRLPQPVLPGQLRPPVPAVPEPAPPRGRLTRRQRAEREAVRISHQYNWARGFTALADSLDREHWGQLRVTIEEEIARGMTPEEFELVLQLRSYWHDQPHYQSLYTSRYDSMPWGLALNLVRRMWGVPCLDEMIILLERFYAYAPFTFARDLPAFSQRLGAIIETADPDVDLEFWLSAQEAWCSYR